MRLYRVDPDADGILAEGFVDRVGYYGFEGLAHPLKGVFVSDRPVGIEEASGEVLVIDLPDDLDISEYFIDEDVPPGWRREWCIPAAVLNALGVVERETG